VGHSAVQRTIATQRFFISFWQLFLWLPFYSDQSIPRSMISRIQRLIDQSACTVWLNKGFTVQTKIFVN